MAPSRREFLKHTAGGLAGTSLLALVPELRAMPLHLPRKLAVGLAGIGRQGRLILNELTKFDDVELAGICDVDPSRLRAGERRAPGATAAPNAQAMFDALTKQGKKLDALIVATPTHTHRELCELAWARDCHLYCEAPLASTEADARALALGAREQKHVVQCGMQARTNPVYELARSFFRAGAIGKLCAMRGQWHQKSSWRTPSPAPELEKARNWKLDASLSLGLLGEMGTQQFDVFHWFLEEYPLEVRASGGILAYDDGRAVEDHVRCELRFKSGATLQYEASLANSFEGEHEVLYGLLGTIKLAWSHGWMFKEADAPTQGWEVYANRQQFHDDEGITLIAGATKLAEQGKLKAGVGLPHPPLYYALASFFESITKQLPVACTAEEGMRATLVALAAHTSLRSGLPVGISPESLTASGK